MYIEFTNDAEYLLENWTHSQILLTILGVWILYSFLTSIDYHKICHSFKCRRRPYVNPKTVKDIKAYWTEKVQTGVETFTTGLPMESVDKKKLEDLLNELAKVNMLFIRFPYF